VKWTVPLALAVFAVLAATAADAPEQPIPFSHKNHAGTLGLACKTCHANPDPGETEGLPPSATCMDCHDSIKTDSPAIRKLTAYYENKRPIPWVRLYSIPDYVRFSHRDHMKAGNQCADCHGKVAESEQLARVVDLTMGTCLNCHKSKNANTDCTFCHDQR
jgi:hypothetical protein